MKKQKSKIGLFLVAGIFTSQMFFGVAAAQSYFDQVLAGVSKIGIIKDTINRFGDFKGNVNFWNFGKSSEMDLPKEVNVVDTAINNENIFLGEEKIFFEDTSEDADGEDGELVLSKEEQKKVEEEKKKEEAKKKQENILGSILQKLGFTASSPNSATRPNQTSDSQSLQSGTANIQNTNPFVYSQPQVPINNNQNFPQTGLSPYSGDALRKYLGGQSVAPSSPQMLATPYSGPGGSLPGECGIPKGPLAYNIGGNGVSCNAETVVTGFKTQLRGKFGAGYINPLTEKGQSNSGASSGNCVNSSTAKKYGEGCFANYASGAGQAYIQEQLLHWQAQGKVKGQKCVPVDIDNCDSIGSANYKNILDQVEIFNNQADVKIKVLTKNPHLGGCNFFSHPAVVGAFIEEISPADAQKVSQMRNKPEQILLFARGGTGSNQKLKQIESLKIPNSAYSYDQGGEYQNIVDCTYNP